MKIILTGVLILFILSFFFCGQSPEDIPHHIFLLNHIESARISKTPDLSQLKLKKQQKTILLNQNSDINLPSSPLLKKIKCLDETRNALFAPADSIIDFPVNIKKGAVLELGFACDDMYLNQERVPVEFKVLIKKKTGKKFRLLFQQVVVPGDLASLGWHDKSLSLEKYAGEVLLRFETKKYIDQTSLGEDLFAYWSNPLLIHPLENKKKKRKLILISLDTLRADHLEMYDYKRKTAPGLVGNAGDFVLFKNCWSQWCWTTESHQSIMTGLFEVEHHVPEFYPSTPGHLVTLAEIMKNQGYMTAAFSGGAKVAAYTGLCKGFDTYYDNEQGKEPGLELLGTWLKTKQWLKKNAQNDFFLFFHTYEIHAPYKTNIPAYDDMFPTGQEEKQDNDYIFRLKRELIGAGLDKVNWYWRDKPGKITNANQDVIRGYRDYYDGSIRYTNDYFLEELIALLKTLDIYDDTIIVILSDHGEEFFEHQRFYHFDGLYEEYIHVPLMFKFTNSQYGGNIFRRNVQTIDVFPTLLEALEIPLEHRVSGRSLWGLIKQGSKKALKKGGRYVFSQSSAKFVVKKESIKLLLRARVDHKTRAEIPRIEIFDLSQDPREQHPIKIDDLSQHLEWYDAVYKKIIKNKRGIHIVFSEKLQGKTIEGEIDIPAGHPEIKTFYEIGVTREDFTRYGAQKKKIIFQWKMAGWKKSMILTYRKNKLKIGLKLKIDGRDYRDFIVDESLDREGEYIKLSGRSYKPGPRDKEAEVFLFGNGVIKKTATGKYFPGITKKNLEKLKELGYIN